MYQQAMLEVTEQDHLRKVAIGCVSRDGEAKPVKLKKKNQSSIGFSQYRDINIQSFDFCKAMA